MEYDSLRDGTLELFKTIAEELGLTSFQIQTDPYYVPNEINPKIFIALSKTITVDYKKFVNKNNDLIFKEILDPIFDDIKNSRYIQSELSAYKLKMASLEKKVLDLNDKNKELQKFKDYYDLSLKMEHGKEIN